MEGAHSFHQDVLKLTYSSLELLKHSLEEKAKCQKTEEREVNYKSNQMRVLIDKLKDLVLVQLDVSKQENLKITEDRAAETEQQLSSLNGSQVRTEKLTIDISFAGSDLQRKEESKVWRIRSLQCCSGLDDVSFKTTENKKKNVTGRIEDRIVYETKPKSKPPIPRNSVICGLAILNNELYVASDRSTDIEVFDARGDTLDSIRKFAVKGLVQASDVQASVKHDCLYIMDGSNGQRNEIFVTDTNGKVSNKWAVENRGNLSITEEGTVVLTVNVTAKIVEYSHDGHLIQEICLSEIGVQNFWHAIKLRCGNFVVSYSPRENHLVDASGICEEETNNTNRPGISIVDSSGVILKELSNLQFHDPMYMYLVVDRCGSILVADCGTGQVLLLNSDLEYQREIVTSSRGVELPTAISLCSSTGQLFVADNSRNFCRCWAFCVTETS